MNWFEKTFVYSHKLRPKLWFRFIDDVWGLFKGTRTEFKQFVDDINRAHLSIKFTVEFSKEKVVFLDTITYVMNGKIFTSLYVKATDNHGYLDYSSCHPYHNKSSIPYSQFVRIRQICSKWEDFVYHSMRLRVYFSLRGYPLDLVDESLNRAMKLDHHVIKI